MRKGTPFPRFGERGLHYVSLGKNGKPLLVLLYGEDDRLLAKLVHRPTPPEEMGADLFTPPRSPGEPPATQLVELLPDGSRIVVHDRPADLAANLHDWIVFLDQWIRRHEQIPKGSAAVRQARATPSHMAV